MSSLAKELAKRLAARRAEKGLSQEDLGRAIGVTRQTIYSYEKGEGKATLETIGKLATALGVDDLDLVGAKPASLANDIRQAIREEISVALLPDPADVVGDRLEGVAQRGAKQETGHAGHARPGILSANEVSKRGEEEAAEDLVHGSSSERPSDTLSKAAEHRVLRAAEPGTPEKELLLRELLALAATLQEDELRSVLNITRKLAALTSAAETRDPRKNKG